MSYFKKIEYEIVVEESFPVLRNCAGCGRKTYFKNRDSRTYNIVNSDVSFRMPGTVGR